MTRQSDYKPEYDEQVIDWLADGGTVAGFAKKIGVNNTTIYRWVKAFPSFSNSIKEGQDIAIKLYAPQFMLDAVRDDTVQSVPFIMYCRNVFGLKTKDDNKQDSDMDALKEAIGSQVIKQFVLPKNGRDDPDSN